jgi:hypothetical protein
MYFAETGDSGAVVVNERHQVIGLLTGRINFTVSPEIRGQLGSIPEYIQSIGIVIPIHNVLEALDIEIPPDLASTEPTRGSEIGEGIHPLTDLEERLQEVRRRIFSQLSQVPLGKAALEKIEEHQQEVVQLVHHHRPVKVVYHRNQGPAFASHLFKSLLDPLHVIPGSVDGISRQTFITQLAKALKEYGSAGLKADIDAFFPIIMKHATNIDGIESFIELLVKEYKTQ